MSWFRRHHEPKEYDMADLTALGQAVADLQTAVAAVQTDVATLKASATDQATVDAQTAQVQNATAELNALVAPPAPPA